jgi:hypothetical protein
MERAEGKRSNTHPLVLRLSNTAASPPLASAVGQHPFPDNSPALSTSARKKATLKFPQLTVVISEATSPPAKTRKVKQFYAQNSPEEPKSASERIHSTSPQPTSEPLSAIALSHSANISPTPEPVTPPPIPHQETYDSSDASVRVTWGEDDESEKQRRMKDFGQWIRLGETGFLKPRQIRKTY